MTKSENAMAFPQLKSFNSQIVFLACQLIQNASMDCLISLEKIGDVGIEGEENKIIELKNVDSNNNILSNSSVDLWKTIFNWTVFFYEHPDMDIDDFQLRLLVYTKNEGNGDIADAMNKCDDVKYFKSIEKEIIDKVLKDKPKRRSSLDSVMEAKKDDKGKAKYYVHCLFSKDLYEYFKRVVIKFRYVKYKETYRDSLCGLIEQIYGCKDRNVTEELSVKFLGWVNNKCQKMMEKNEPIVIKSKDYFEFSEKYVGPYLSGNKYRSHALLEPSKETIEKQISLNPLYIKQLNLINGGAALKNKAVRDYLKLLLERRNWVESGYLACIDDPKYINYQRNINDAWSVEKEFLSEVDNVKKGRELYRVLNRNLNFGYFDGVELDPNIKRGFIQELANLPVLNSLSIGWHPNYVELLQDDKEDDNNDR